MAWFNVAYRCIFDNWLLWSLFLVNGMVLAWKSVTKPSLLWFFLIFSYIWHMGMFKIGLRYQPQALVFYSLFDASTWFVGGFGFGFVLHTLPILRILCTVIVKLSMLGGFRSVYCCIPCLMCFLGSFMLNLGLWDDFEKVWRTKPRIWPCFTNVFRKCVLYRGFHFVLGIKPSLWCFFFSLRVWVGCFTSSLTFNLNPSLAMMYTTNP